MKRYKFWKGDGESGLVPDPAGDWVRLSEMSEPVAEVLWHDPALDMVPRGAGKIIDASIAWMEAAALGTKLYAVSQGAAQAPTDEPVKAIIRAQELLPSKWITEFWGLMFLWRKAKLDDSANPLIVKIEDHLRARSRTDGAAEAEPAWTEADFTLAEKLGAELSARLDAIDQAHPNWRSVQKPALGHQIGASAEKPGSQFLWHQSERPGAAVLRPAIGDEALGALAAVAVINALGEVDWLLKWDERPIVGAKLYARRRLAGRARKPIDPSDIGIPYYPEDRE